MLMAVGPLMADGKISHKTMKSMLCELFIIIHKNPIDAFSLAQSDFLYKIISHSIVYLLRLFRYQL